MFVRPVGINPFDWRGCFKCHQVHMWGKIISANADNYKKKIISWPLESP